MIKVMKYYRYLLLFGGLALLNFSNNIWASDDFYSQPFPKMSETEENFCLDCPQKICECCDDYACTRFCATCCNYMCEKACGPEDSFCGSEFDEDDDCGEYCNCCLTLWCCPCALCLLTHGAWERHEKNEAALLIDKK